MSPIPESASGCVPLSRPVWWWRAACISIPFPAAQMAKRVLKAGKKVRASDRKRAAVGTTCPRG